MKNLHDFIRPTTFIESEPLARHLNADVTIASETFQHTGSFKFRAGMNLALNVREETIVTASSGNFGQALARACRILGKRCVVVMPETSAQVKIEAVRSYGATLDLIDTRKIGRTERVLEIMNDYPDAYRASAYDDLFVIEGNASLGDEIANYRKNFDAVISPVGGGGLSSGVVQAFCNQGKQTEVWGAEPLLGNDAARSLRVGKIVQNETEPTTIADGARTISLGENNWRILQNGLAGIVEVADEKIKEAVRLYFSLANLKSEPTGALSLGAILENPEIFAGKSICLVVSGGNVDSEVYRQILGG
ncbi:MAG TPA: pyridoxal-phosphate dependent enzyme [Pyrinomonadaceae bacterium]|jgi:threonine dehydratase